MNNEKSEPKHKKLSQSKADLKHTEFDYTEW
jgi:hypothetical protein